MTTTLRRVLGTSLAAGLATAAALVTAVPAAADPGLEVAAVSRYVYDADARAVHATMTVDLHNVSPDETSDNGFYTYYYDAYGIPVPTSSTDVRAQSDGRSLSVSVRPTDDPSTSLARISFPDLTYDKTRRIVLSFDIIGRPPRSADQTRMGPGYATFVAYGPGDEGHNRVEVVAPADMDFTSTVDGFDTGDGDDAVTYTATENTFDGGLWAVVSLRDPDQVGERVVDVEDLALVLESYPDDQKWASFVADTVTDGLPTLEELVDNPWPGGLQRIREDAAPSLRGYDGWFDPSGEQIVVGEQLDEDLIYHELSHAWLSGERFDERWIYEGLAQVVAERTVEDTGGSPVDHPTVSRDAASAVPLNDWDGGAGVRSGDVDTYAYPAAYTVVSDLLGDLDDEQFAAVVGAGVRGERAYDPPGTVTPSAGRTSWTDWLDLVQTRAGVRDAPDVFADWVLTDEQADRLPARARERKGYAAVDAGDGPWLPPEGLRDAMTSWDFDRAKAVRRAVRGLGDDVRAVQQAATHTGLDVPDAVRQSYERAAFEDDYTALTTSLPAAARAITAVGAAERVSGADEDPFTELGATLLGIDDRAAHAVSLLEGGEVPDAQAAADDVEQRAGWRLPLGLGLPVAALLLLAGLGWFTAATVRHGRRRSSGLHAEGAAARSDDLAAPAPSEGADISGGTDDEPDEQGRELDGRSAAWTPPGRGTG